MKRILAFMTLLLLCMPAVATDIPSRVEMSYAVTTDIGQGELNEVMEIRHINGAYSYTIDSEAQATGIYKLVKPGSIIRKSQGMITKHGIQPAHFSDQRESKQPSIALFNWEKHVITLHHKGKEEHKPLPRDTLDRLSFSYSFMFVPLPKHHVEKHITDGRSLHLSRFKISKEKLHTPIGEIDTIVLTREEEKHAKVKRKLWLAPNNHMLPVRIVSIEENGREIEKMVTSINISYKPEH